MQVFTTDGAGSASVHLRVLHGAGPKKEVTHHVSGPLLAGWEPWRRDALVGVSVAQAAAFDDEVVDGVVVGGEGGGLQVFGLAGARLAPQQPHSQVGGHEPVLGSRPVRVHLPPGRQGSVDHLARSRGEGRSVRVF